MPDERIILFFDGVCNLCNSWVDFLVRRDKRKQFRYAPLQGTTFQDVLAAHPELAAYDSLIVLHDRSDGTQEILTHSSGPLFLAGRLGGGWSLARVFLLLPRFIRDAGYRLLARIRYSAFGKKATCRVPSAEEQALFLP
jgi:predicted DCC family thiol-disulfide oxidoreductase YuxK